MEIDERIDKIIHGEIEGKNRAIHAYDKIIWMIRSGYLTVFFIAWSILLKTLLEHGGNPPAGLNGILLAMLLITLILSMGAFVIDINYIRRKFRVIHALDALLACLLREDFQIRRNVGEISQHLQVAGDKDNDNYRKVSGYRPAFHAGLYLYFSPPLMAVVLITVLWRSA